MEEKTYYDYLFEESEEEKKINAEVDAEMKRHEATEEYIAHNQKLDELLKKLKVAGEERRKEAEKHKPKRTARAKKINIEAIKEQNKKIQEERIKTYPEELQSLIKAYNNLDDTAKRVFNQETWCHHTGYNDYKDPKTTKKDMKELLEILVQTTIDFINERELTDIYSVGFGADDLQTSAKSGEWTPATDASIYITGLGKEVGRNGEEYSVLQNIGSYM